MTGVQQIVATVGEDDGPALVPPSLALGDEFLASEDGSHGFQCSSGGLDTTGWAGGWRSRNPRRGKGGGLGAVAVDSGCRGLNRLRFVSRNFDKGCGLKGLAILARA
jgi:hypothetical protein